MLKTIQFATLSGNGNIFSIVDNRENVILKDDYPKLSKIICNVDVSKPSDGIVFLEKSNNANFRGKYFNRDGSEVDMFANGSRCASYYFITVNSI